MRERILIYDTSGACVNDPDKSAQYATGLRWESMWPKGYGPLSFRVSRDIVAQWAAKAAYGVKIFDGLRIVYQGRLNSLGKALQSGSEYVNVSAAGWYIRLVERKMRKRWVDNHALQYVEWPAGVTQNDQELFQEEFNQEGLLVRMVHKDATRDPTDIYYQNYVTPNGYIKRVTFDWATRTGEGINILIYNVDQAADEWDNDPDQVNGSGSADHTFTQGDTTSFDIRIYPDATDTYDPNDYARVNDLWVYSETALTQSDIIEDVLAALGTDLSSDYDEIGSPGYTLNPFSTLNDDFETGDSIIQRVASYGDASLNTWGLSVWDSAGTSDDLPKAVFETRDVSDYEYQVSLADLQSFSDDETDDELYNWIPVKYTDEKDRIRYITPDDDSDLKDTDSISDYGQRDAPTIDVGVATSTLATNVGKRYLEYHKDPLHKTSMVIVGEIRTKEGIRMPANQVRAGQRVKLVDYGGGTIYFLRHTSYDAESATLTMSPDLPPDDLAVFFAQRERGLIGD